MDRRLKSIIRDALQLVRALAPINKGDFHKLAQLVRSLEQSLRAAGYEPDSRRTIAKERDSIQISMFMSIWKTGSGLPTYERFARAIVFSSDDLWDESYEYRKEQLDDYIKFLDETEAYQIERTRNGKLPTGTRGLPGQDWQDGNGAEGLIELAQDRSQEQAEQAAPRGHDIW